MRMGVSDVHLLAYLPNDRPLGTLQPGSAKDILAHSDHYLCKKSIDISTLPRPTPIYSSQYRADANIEI